MGVMGMKTVGTFYSDRIFNYLKKSIMIGTLKKDVVN